MHAGVRMSFVTMFNTLLLLLVISIAAADKHINRNEVFARLNYAVIFRPQQPIQLVTDEWTHVVIAQLPEYHNDPRDEVHRLGSFNCSSLRQSKTSCESFQPLFQTLMTLHEISLRRIRSVIDHIYSILPEDHHRDKHTRGIFDFGGQILHSLFGVATDDQVDAVRTAARHSLTENANALDVWQRHADTMTSFMSVANKRLDNLAQVVRDHQTVVQTIHDSVSRIDTDISYLRILLTSAI